MTRTICNHTGLAVGQRPKKSARPREEMARASTPRKRRREALMASAAYANVWPTSRQTSLSPRTDQSARYGSACSMARSTTISTRVVAAAACGNRLGANMAAATAGAVFAARHRGHTDHSKTLFSMVVSSMATYERDRDSPSISCYPLGNMEPQGARGRYAWHHEPQAPSMPISGVEYA